MSAEESVQQESKCEGMDTKKKVLLGCGGCLGVCLFVALAMGTCTAVGVREAAKQEKAQAEKVATQEADIEIHAMRLLAAYKNNEVGADQQYKGKVLQVSGVVGDVKKDMMDNLYVTLGSGEKFEVRRVQCFFQDKYQDQISNLRKGGFLTVKGRCEGLMMNVLLKDCIIVQ